MEVISTNQIVDPNAQQPLTGKSLTFLQNALRKDDAGIIQALVTKIVGSYSLTVPYVIDGCVLSDSNKDVTNGTLFYGGKFYEVVGVNGTTNVARFILTKSQDITADPVTFTDGSSKNVHDIYKYVATDVASGGDFIATDLVYLASVIGKINTEITPSNQSISATSYVDVSGSSYTTPADGKTRTYLLLAKTCVDTTGVPSTVGEGAYLSIYSTSTLDESYSYLNISGASHDGKATITCMKIATISFNTVIKLQGKTFTGSSVGFNNTKFEILEL